MSTNSIKPNRRIRNGIGLSCTTLAFALVAACTDVQTPKGPKQSQMGVSSAAKFDPSKAAVSVEFKTESMEGYPKGSVPTLSLAFTGANSTEVFRCGASYEMKYGNGVQKLSDLSPSDPSYQESAEDAFKRLRTATSDCIMIGVGNSINRVRDYGAQSGEFYYVVNPCVTSEQSTTARAGCSYRLAITKPVTYTNTRAQAEVEILNTFLKAEGDLYANFKEMEALAVAINSISTSCVLDEAERKLVAQRSQALMSLVKTVATTVINGLAPGVGTALGAVVDALGNLRKAGLPNAESSCPDAVTKTKRYQELEANVTAIATRVIEARKELHALDSAYTNVDAELSKLKEIAAK